MRGLRSGTATATSRFFGIHPMRVESGAGIAARKDAPYAFFCLPGLIGYLRHPERRRWAWLAVCLAAFVLSAICPYPVKRAGLGAGFHGALAGRRGCPRGW